MGWSLASSASIPPLSTPSGPAFRGKVLDWLRVNGPATKTDMKKAGLGQWPAIEAALALLMKEGKVDAAPGRTQGSLYFVIEASTDGSKSRA